MSVLVVGSGLAGSASALALAEAGVDVVQVASGPGATALSGGSLDVAGASPGVPTLPWRDPLRGTILTGQERLRLVASGAPSHPYAAWFSAAEASEIETGVTEAVVALNRWLAPAGLAVEGRLDANRVLANARGTLRVTDFAFTGPASGDLAAAREIHVADLPLEGWEARDFCRMLALELDALGLPERPLRIVRPHWPERLLAPGEVPARLAARLDDARVREDFVRGLRGLGGEGCLLLLPPVLGFAHTRELLDAASRASGCRVAETLGLPPQGLAGLRLQRALGAALEDAGVRTLAGRARTVTFTSDGALKLRVEPNAGEGARSLDGSALVLATGRFLAGGLADAGGAVREALLDLPLFDDDGRRVDGVPPHRSVRKGYANRQPLYRAGVRTDALLRPLAADGRPRAAQLFAAGDLLGGWDSGRERVGLGIALLSGLRAARELLAARKARL